jgi:hypothetical protein
MAPKKQTPVTEQTPAPAPAAPVEEKKKTTKKTEAAAPAPVPAPTPAPAASSSKKADSKKADSKKTDAAAKKAAAKKADSKKADSKKADSKKTDAADKKPASPREKRPKPTKESFLADLQAAETKLAELVKQLGELKLTEAKKIVNEFYRGTFSDIVKDSKKVKELKVKNDRSGSQNSGFSTAVAISQQLADFCKAQSAKVVAYMKGDKKYEGKDLSSFSEWSTATDANKPEAGKHSRTKITTFLCAYIAMNNLKDSVNKRFISFDDNLCKLFNVADKQKDTVTAKKGERWTFTSLQSLLKHCNHYPK